jgi:CDP-diacylglycerol--glycerol-3-phosphate 3-phosphatidyltransferase
MLNLHARPALNRMLVPVGTTLVRLGATADVITIIGTVGVAVGAFVFFPRGHLFGGTIFITCFVFSDLIDGVVARARGTSGPWGAFLDSTLDRIGDGAVFGSLVWWYAGGGHQPILGGLTLGCLVGGTVISYAKARAESLGFTANVGVAERSERLIVVLVTTGLSGLGIPYVAAIGLWALGIATAFTVCQRLLVVRRQVQDRADGPTSGVVAVPR